MGITVIVPVLNERASVGPLIDALLEGHRVPDEIVFGDGGSTDGTREYLEERSIDDPRIRVVDGPGGISENRNAAIRDASTEWIACTDAGCIPEPRWLEHLSARLDAGADWVAGMSKPERLGGISESMGLLLMPVPSEVNPEFFIPGGASQAFKKEAWKRAGGFPEGMVAAEDTVFGYRMKTAGFEPVFTPEAMVRWEAPASFPAMLRKAVAWGRADGQAGFGTRSYLKIIALYWGLLGATVVGLALRPGIGVGAGIALLGMAVWRTRKKFSRASGLARWWVLPLGHVAKLCAQSYGWFVAFVPSLRGRKPARRFVYRMLMRAVVSLKRTIRPLVPDRWVAKVRTALASGDINIDIIVENAANASRWLIATPDTYRVRTVDSLPEAVAPFRAARAVDEAIEEDLIGRVLADPKVEVVIVGRANPPRVDRTRVSEVGIAAQVVAARDETWPLIESNDPQTSADLAIQAGRRIALLPTKATTEASPRAIEGIGAFVMLGTVPMHDVGGGSRGSQMAQEMVARGYHVTYLHMYDANESADLGLRYVHPNLERVRFSEFEVDQYLSRLRCDDRLAVLELPHPGFLPIVQKLRSAGFKVAYDLMDDWSDPALGGWGYAEWAEIGVAVASDVLIASAPSLVRRLEQLSNRPVELVANAVNTRLFVPGEYERPADLPETDGMVFEYHGSLYGDWFDWDELNAVAEGFPDATLAIIGDERGHPEMPANVHFLGLKAQFQLPAYVAHTDVALISFKVSETTHSVSPLKVFEYMAMGVPVAAPPLQPLLGLDGVHTDTDLVAAVTAALVGAHPDPDRARTEHGWETRLRTIFNAAGLELKQDPTMRPLKILQRRVRHYSPDERLIR